MDFRIVSEDTIREITQFTLDFTLMFLCICGVSICACAFLYGALLMRRPGTEDVGELLICFTAVMLVLHLAAIS